MTDDTGDAWATSVVDVIRGPAGKCAIARQASVGFPDRVRFVVGTRAFLALSDAESYARRITGAGTGRPTREHDSADVCST